MFANMIATLFGVFTLPKGISQHALHRLLSLLFLLAEHQVQAHNPNPYIQAHVHRVYLGPSPTPC